MKYSTLPAIIYKISHRDPQLKLNSNCKYEINYITCSNINLPCKQSNKKLKKKFPFLLSKFFLRDHTDSLHYPLSSK